MIAFLCRALLLFLALGLAVRAYIASFIDAVPAWVWIAGLGNDVLAAALMFGVFSPVVLVPNRVLRRGLVAVAVAIALIVAAAEAFYWIEFESRLDRLVFHYLAYPIEVLVFLDEQFYLTWVGLPFVVLVYCIAIWLNPPVTRRPAYVAGAVLVAVLVGALARQGTPDASRHLNQAASNGYIGVLTAATIDVSDADALFGDAAAVEPVSVAHRSRGLADAHVVLVIEESMAGKSWTDLASRERVFPELLAVAREGVLFDQAFATGSRTTRGMEAILNGFPPLPGISTTERTRFRQLPSLARALSQAGYHTVFAYGGWPDFSNFTNYWQGTGFSETTSRDDFKDASFMTSWGASDDDLFRFALELMDERTAQHERVFMSLLTVSHHRPFELPPDSPFAGGRSAEHALRYADAALGRFMDAARSRDWFDNTLFVIVADHGPKTRGDRLIPVGSYRVPLVLRHPLLEPAVRSRAVSTMSVPRTLTNLLEVSHSEGFWGTDLFAETPGPLPVEHDYHVGWIDGQRLFVLTRDGQRFGWDLRSGSGVVAPELPGMAGYFRLAHERFYGR